jgi:hypothetical protein
MKNSQKMMSRFPMITRFSVFRLVGSSEFPKASNKRLRRTSLSVLLAAFALMFALAIPQDGFAKTTKKKKVTVNVEENGNCPYGVSMSDQSWGSGSVCAPNYPPGAADTLRGFAGQRIEVEAQFQYAGDPKNTPPDRVNKLIRIAGHKVYDPCPTSLVILAGINAGLSKTDPILPPGCSVDADAGTDTSSQAGGNPQ